MLRPIDTQTIYQQTQELSNRQHVQSKSEHTQQGQFAQIMQKHTELKKESVNELQKDEKVNNELNQEKEKGQHPRGKNKKKKLAKDKSANKWDKDSKIDIRI